MPPRQHQQKDENGDTIFIMKLTGGSYALLREKMIFFCQKWLAIQAKIG